MRAVVVLPASLLAYLALEFVLFHAGLYGWILEPDSSTAFIETLIRHENHRAIANPNQVIGVGHSRMGFFPRYANELQPPLPYRFATISAGGSSPRVWYYMLRAVDPKVERFSAIIIPFEDYEDADHVGDDADTMTDLNYLALRLGWSDLPEFSGSYHDPLRKSQAIRELLFKGTIFQRDFQEFLKNPGGRIKHVIQIRTRDTFGDFYNYVGPSKGLEDFQIGWAPHTLTAPPGTSPVIIERFERRFLQPRPAEKGLYSAYLHYWIGKIYDRYRGSRTKLIFIRLPRGPWVRPDQPAPNPHSSVRDFGELPGVIVCPEHTFDFLERPELFMDELHLNGPGSAAFSPALGREVVRLLTQ
jgi:hypothetical protein